MIPGTKIKKPRVKLIGTDGNAFAIMGEVTRALRKAGVDPQVVSNYKTEAMSGDYNHLLVTSMNYVDVR